MAENRTERAVLISKISELNPDAIVQPEKMPGLDAFKKRMAVLRADMLRQERDFGGSFRAKFENRAEGLYVSDGNGAGHIYQVTDAETGRQRFVSWKDIDAVDSPIDYSRQDRALTDGAYKVLSSMTGEPKWDVKFMLPETDLVFADRLKKMRIPADQYSMDSVRKGDLRVGFMYYPGGESSDEACICLEPNGDGWKMLNAVGMSGGEISLDAAPAVDQWAKDHGVDTSKCRSFQSTLDESKLERAQAIHERLAEDMMFRGGFDDDFGL